MVLLFFEKASLQGMKPHEKLAENVSKLYIHYSVLK